jgi:hypothetical protein
VFVAGWLASDSCGHERDQEWGVGIGDAEIRLAHGLDVDAELLSELAAGGGFVGFVRFNFASGEFPEAAVALVGRSPADEEAAASADYSRNYADIAGCGRRRELVARRHSGMPTRLCNWRTNILRSVRPTADTRSWSCEWRRNSVTRPWPVVGR